jgi:hypothetical protein
MPTPPGPPPSRWTLRTIRASVDWLHDYTLGGVWRVLERYGIRLRSGRVQQFSPDPEYVTKVMYLETCLQTTALNPTTHVLVFMDEMGYYRWPTPAADWMLAAPEPVVVAPCAENNKQWRTLMYQTLDQLYPQAEHIYVVQDNWSIHSHPDVLGALAAWPHIEPVWLPTYAPWLNPIEKLWRWLRQDVLKMHRLAADWPELHQRVNAFLDQFMNGSQELLHYVGLLGDGKLAQALRAA